METIILIPLVVEIATIILLLVAIGALLSIIKMVDGRLLRGWKLMLIAIGFAVATQGLGLMDTLGILNHPFQIYTRFAFVFFGVMSLWKMAKTLDDCRTQSGGH